MGDKFYVEPAKLRGYSEQVSRSAADVGAIGGYIQVRCADTGGFDGLLEVLRRPVRSFADSQARLLDDWQQRLLTTKIGLWATAWRYEDTDAANRGRMDDLAGEASSVSPSEDAASDLFACFAGPEDYLKPPAAPDNSAHIAAKDIGSVFSTVNWVVEKATGRNLVQEIIQPISGDWGKIRMQAEAWANVSLALESVHDNMERGLGNLEPFWEGETARVFGSHMEQWLRGLREESDLARAAAEKLELVAQTSEAIFTQLADTLGKIADKAWQVPLSSIIPIARGPLLAKLAKDTIDLIKNLDKLIEELTFTLESLREFMDAILAHANVSAPPETLVPEDGYEAPQRLGR